MTAPTIPEGQVRDRDPDRELVPYRGGSGLAIGASLAELTDDQFSERLESLRKQQARIKQIQEAVMVAGADYGNVPGTERPTLLKGGAEKLCNLYGLVARIEVTMTLGDPDNGATPTLSVDAICYLHVTSFDGPIVGKGHGNANSWEKKYRYINVRQGLVCPDCGKGGVIKTRRGPYWHPDDAKPDGGCGGHFDAEDDRLKSQKPKVDRVSDPDPWDKRNTLIKMAEKRAHVDATLRATATSALFTQDLEDSTSESPEGVRRGSVSTNAAEGSAAWLAANLTNARIPPSQLQDALAAMDAKGKSFSDLTDEQRRELWLRVSGGEVVVQQMDSEEGLPA